MKIFCKYYLKENFFNTFVFLIVFGVIITLVQGIIKLQEFLELNPSFKVIFQIFLLTFFQLLSFVYSLSAFMGVLFSIHRFKHEREILAFFSLGLSLKDFLQPLLLFSFISLIISFFGHFFLLPYAKRNEKLIQIELIKAQVEKPFPEKKPFSLGKDYYLYAAKTKKEDKTHYFKNILLLEKKEDKKGFFISQNASFSFDENLFTLEKGWGFFIDSQNNLEVLKFENYKFKISVQRLEEKIYFKRGEKSFSELKEDIKKLKPGSSRYFKYLNEYYQRIFFPISVVFLSFQGFFLGFFVKTSHRFLVFFIGITVFLIFYILYNFFSSLGENGRIYPLLSFSCFYLLAIFFLFFQYFIFRKKRELYL